jgi:hypothetical protein
LFLSLGIVYSGYWLNERPKNCWGATLFKESDGLEGT